MREGVYLILTLALASPAAGFENPPKSGADIVRRSDAPARLDLQTPMFLAWPLGDALASIHGPRAGCSMVCAAASPTAPPMAHVKAWDHNIPQFANAARGAIAWVLPTGLSVLAAGAFGQTTLIGQSAWPLGATVPTAKASATIALDLSDIAGSPMRVDLSVNNNWQLDAPVGGTYPDCAVRLDVAVAFAPQLSLRAPCGTAGHFGIGLRGRF